MAETYAVWPDRDVISASGPETAAYLQGQLSQDVFAIEDMASAWSWVLSPQGKVEALVRVTRRSDDDWLIDTDAGYGEAVVGRLNKFKLRSKVELALLPWRVLRLVGAPPDPGEIEVAFKWGPLSGVDVFGPDVVIPEGVRLMSPAEYEARRILAGFPKMGAELTEKTIPAEVGCIDATVSFTKGCYTGQELVARIDSRGSNVPRHLRVLLPAGAVHAGAELTDADGKPAGSVTSAADRPGGWVALGYVRRSVGLPGPVWADGVEVEVQEVPQ